MKNSIVTVICAVLLSAVGLSAVPNDPQEEKQVLATMDRMGEAMVKKDVATLTKVLHEDMLWGRANGITWTKDEMLKTVSGSQIWEGFKFSKPIVHIYGSTAVVRCLVDLRTGIPPSNPMHDEHFTVLLVLVKGPQGWQIVGEQWAHPTE